MKYRYIRKNPGRSNNGLFLIDDALIYALEPRYSKIKAFILLDFHMLAFGIVYE
ncbi:MAG: hypothetical protein DDT28_00795 [Dehalococcoidia bacterium]|nr:hypothetical protein [Chloroflexota bacterium]